MTEWAFHDLDDLRELLEMLQRELHAGIGLFQRLDATPGVPASAWPISRAAR